MLGWLRQASGAGAGDGYNSSAVFLGAGIVIIQSLDKTFRHFAISHQIWSKTAISMRQKNNFLGYENGRDFRPSLNA